MAEVTDENKEIKENPVVNETEKEPVPLALEGASAQLELDVKPKPQNKDTKVHYNNKNLIKNMIATPKEKPGGESPTNSDSTSGPTTPPKEEIKSIQDRLAKEQDQYEGEKPSEDECKDTADMFVFILDMILAFIASKFALDKDDDDYKMDPTRKKTLTKYLAIYLAKMNKKYPIGFMLCVTAIVCCLPVFSKAYNHRKLVEEKRAEEKAAKKATVVASDASSGGKKRRRRSDDDDITENKKSKGDDNLGYTPVEIVS